MVDILCRYFWITVYPMYNVPIYYNTFCLPIMKTLKKKQPKIISHMSHFISEWGWGRGNWRRHPDRNSPPNNGRQSSTVRWLPRFTYCKLDCSCLCEFSVICRASSHIMSSDISKRNIYSLNWFFRKNLHQLISS